MGQWYTPMIETTDGQTILYSRQLVNEPDLRAPAKLMEHSWWENDFVNTLCNKIYYNPCKVAWVGDEANDFDRYDEVMDGKTVDIDKCVTKLDNRFLINHTKKLYVDCNEYKKRSMTDTGWCIHPLPLLTAIGNGNGGGDYFSKACRGLVGTWALDYISVQDDAPTGSEYKKLDVYFKEDEDDADIG